MAARINEVLDAVVTLIQTAWSPSAPSAVTRCYEAPVNADTIQGRQVFVFPVGYADEPASRGEDAATYTFAVLVVEKFREQSAPPVAWVDERVEFVESKVYDVLANFGQRKTYLTVSGHGRLICETAEVDVFDWPTLRQKFTFWSESTFALKEIA